MRLGPAPVVRLEGPLAHQKTPRSCCQRGHANRTTHPRVHGPVRRGTASIDHPLRAGDNGRCQASTRYGRADRGVKRGRRVAPAREHDGRLPSVRSRRMSPRGRTTGGSVRFRISASPANPVCPLDGHSSPTPPWVASTRLSVAGSFASRVSGQQAMVLCAALGESATRRGGSICVGRRRSAHPGPG